MSEEPPINPSPAATVLIVGSTRDVLERASEVLAPTGGEARMTTLAKLREDTMQLRPLIVLVDAYLYDFDPQSFDTLARDAGAKLGVVSNSNEAAELLQRAISAPGPSGPHKTSEPTATTGRREFDTAKYDAKTIEDGLERMGATRNELPSQNEDVKTPDEAIKRMGDS